MSNKIPQATVTGPDADGLINVYLGDTIVMWAQREDWGPAMGLEKEATDADH